MLQFLEGHVSVLSAQVESGADFIVARTEDPSLSADIANVTYRYYTNFISSSGERTSPFSLLEPATPASFPVAPNMQLGLLSSGLIGLLMFAVGLVLVHRSINTCTS